MSNMFNSTRKGIDACRSSFRSIGAAFLSPGSVSSYGEDLACTPLVGKTEGEENMIKGIRSFITRLGVESDRFRPLDEDGSDGNDETQVSSEAASMSEAASILAEDWKRDELYLGNKENQKRSSNPLSSPQSRMRLGSDGGAGELNRLGENGLPTPLGSARTPLSNNPTPRNSILTPRNSNAGFTTPRSMPTYGLVRTNSAIPPISEEKVCLERSKDVLPTRTFSFDEESDDLEDEEDEDTLTTLASEKRKSLETVTSTLEPEPVVSPRGDSGPLYLVQSNEAESGMQGGAAHEPEPVVSPKGATGPIYMQTTTVAVPETKQEDPYEWAYEIWRARGLMPRKVKEPLLCITGTAKMKGYQNPSKGIVLFAPQNGELALLDTTPKSESSRRTRFANVLQKWKDKSNDNPNSHFLAQYGQGSPPLLPEPFTELPNNNEIVAASSSSILTPVIRQAPQTQLSNYLSKYSPPRTTASRRRIRCSLDTSEVIYNDGSEPFVRQASERTLFKRIQAQQQLGQQEMKRVPGPPCREIIVQHQEDDPLNLTWPEDSGIGKGPPDETPSHALMLGDVDEASRDLVVSEDLPLLTWPSPEAADLPQDLAIDQRDDNQLVRLDDSDENMRSEALIPYAPSQYSLVSDEEDCLCGKAFIEGNDDLVNFFLPRLDIGCTCRQHHEEFLNPYEPTALENILRPWQCEFLRKYGIWKGDQLVKAHHRSASVLVKGLKNWRIHQQGLRSVRTRSCVMALNIWSRSCKSYVRSIRTQLSAGKVPLQRPNILGSVSLFLQQMDVDGFFQSRSTPRAKQDSQPKLPNRKSNGSAPRKATPRPAIEAESQIEL